MTNTSASHRDVADRKKGDASLDFWNELINGDSFNPVFEPIQLKHMCSSNWINHLPTKFWGLTKIPQEKKQHESSTHLLGIDFKVETTRGFFKIETISLLTVV